MEYEREERVWMWEEKVKEWKVEEVDGGLKWNEKGEIDNDG
jgi:hypothetical protein